MVERFYGPLMGFEMRLGKRGDYVRHSDYADLERQIAELRAEVERVRDGNRYAILEQYAIARAEAAESRVSALSAEVERLRLPEGTLAKHGSTITIEFDGAEYAIRAFDALEYAMSGEPAALGERP